MPTKLMKGEVAKVTKRGSFYFEMRRPPTTDGSSVEFIVEKEGSKVGRSEKGYNSRKVVVKITYKRVIARMKVK